MGGWGGGLDWSVDLEILDGLFVLKISESV